MFDWGECDFSLEAQDVLVSGSIAVERGKYVLRFSAEPDAPDEISSYEDKGNYVALWMLENDGEWRIVWDAAVSELPIPGATRRSI